MVYESGRESIYIDDIEQGFKTYEGRLNRGKFAEYRAGDFVWLRRDHRIHGELVDGEPRQLLVRVVSVRRFPSFREMLSEVGYAKVIPHAKNLHEAVGVYSDIYTAEEEATAGVLAIEIKVADPSELPKEESL